MKKFVLACLSFAVLIFVSCSSTKISLNEYESIAVIGITGNKNLSEQVDTLYVRSDEEDTDDTNLLSMVVDKFLHGENPELLTGQDRVDYAEEYFHHALEEIAGLTVAEKERVIESEQYKSSVVSPLGFMDTWASASGFDKNLYSIGSKKARMMMNELNVKSLVAAEFRFNKLFDDESKVKTNVRAQVIMDVILYDKNGKKTVIEQFKDASLTKLPVRKFKYDTDALIEMYPPLIENVINRFVLEYVD